MLNTMNSSGLAALLLVGSLAGCVQAKGVDTDSAVIGEPESSTETAIVLEDNLPIAHPKTGAAIAFSHDELSEVSVGENGTITFIVEEGYDRGFLKLEASGEDGLNVFGASASAQMDMQDESAHTWQVNYSAEADGVYYLNALAIVEFDDGAVETRATSARIEIGNWQEAQSKLQAERQVDTLPTGEPAVIMEAEETIE